MKNKPVKYVDHFKSGWAVEVYQSGAIVYRNQRIRRLCPSHKNAYKFVRHNIGEDAMQDYNRSYSVLADFKEEKNDD